MTTTTEGNVNNGVNVAALLEARAALSEAPESFKGIWRVDGKWVKFQLANS